MKTHAYRQYYIDEAMYILGAAFDYAVYDMKMDIDEFFELFINTGIAEQFGNGNPKYVAGMSGPDIVKEVIFTNTGERPTKRKSKNYAETVEFWAGWSLAYYQWESGHSFKEIYENGLKPSNVKQMYILHEAPLSKFVSEAEKIFSENYKNKETHLKIIRSVCGLSQSALAKSSGVALRMIQLYEQRQNNINKAQAETLLRLSRALGCNMENLLEPER